MTKKMTDFVEAMVLTNRIPVKGGQEHAIRDILNTPKTEETLPKCEKCNKITLQCKCESEDLKK